MTSPQALALRAQRQAYWNSTVSWSMSQIPGLAVGSVFTFATTKSLEAFLGSRQWKANKRAICRAKLHKLTLTHSTKSLSVNQYGKLLDSVQNDLTALEAHNPSHHKFLDWTLSINDRSPEDREIADCISNLKAENYQKYFPTKKKWNFRFQWSSLNPSTSFAYNCTDEFTYPEEKDLFTDTANPLEKSRFAKQSSVSHTPSTKDFGTESPESPEYPKVPDHPLHSVGARDGAGSSTAAEQHKPFPPQQRATESLFAHINPEVLTFCAETGKLVLITSSRVILTNALPVSMIIIRVGTISFLGSWAVDRVAPNLRPWWTKNFVDIYAPKIAALTFPAFDLLASAYDFSRNFLTNLSLDKLTPWVTKMELPSSVAALSSEQHRGGQNRGEQDESKPLEKDPVTNTTLPEVTYEYLGLTKISITVIAKALESGDVLFQFTENVSLPEKILKDPPVASQV